MASIVVRDNIYIPIKYVDEDHVLDQYTTHLFDDQVCKGCDFKRQRPCDECGTCEFGGYTGSYCTAAVVERKNKTYMRIPIGDRADFAEKVGINPKKFTIKDRRSKAKFRVKPKFLGTLRDYQEPVIKAMKKLGYGILKSAPRTGKTVMGIAGGIELKQRIIIIADQKDFLDGFLETIMSSTALSASNTKLGHFVFDGRVLI
jgi:superfamily II DNA or RNA helicase